LTGVLWGYFAKSDFFKCFGSLEGESASLDSLKGHPKKMC